jgi:hypothetical protein
VEERKQYDGDDSGWRRGRSRAAAVVLGARPFGLRRGRRRSASWPTCQRELLLLGVGGDVSNDS